MQVRLLLVEDSRTDLLLLHELLDGTPGLEVDVVAAARLAVALEVLGRERIDVVLLDLGLPDSSC